MSNSANEPFDETLLSAYLDQELEHSERAKVDRELEKSLELRTLFAELSQIRNLVATCNIPLSAETKAISGPWESSDTTKSVSSTTLEAGHAVRTGNWPRLASLAAAIALLMGFGGIVILSTGSGRWVAYQSTNEKVAKREVVPSLAPSALAPSASARTSPARRAPEAIAPAAGSMTTDAADVPMNDPRLSLESTTDSLAAKFMKFMNSDTNAGQSNTGNDKSLTSDYRELSGVFRFQTNAHSDSESGYMLFFNEVKKSKAETLALKGRSDTLERQLGKIREQSNQAISESQGTLDARSKSQDEAKKQVVELIIPDENWEAAKTSLLKKGFVIEETQSNSGDASTADTLNFLATANRSSPAGWTIVAANIDSASRKDEKSNLMAEPAPKVGSGQSRPRMRQSAEKLDTMELKESGMKFRRILVTLSEETTKSSSDE